MTVARQVKIFQSSEITIEDKMNQWLSENATKVDVLDIKIASGGNGGTTIRETYMVIYKNK